MTKIYTFNLPDIGEGIAEAEIVAWHVSVGDTVEEDDQIADMMTDKATVEMEAPVSGKIVKVAGEAGDIIAIGSMLVEIETEGDGSDASDEKEEPREARPDPVEEAEPAGYGTNPVQTTLANDANDKPADVSDDPQPDGTETRRETGKVLASPAVRKRAADLGIDLSGVKPSGDRIRHGDLDAYLTYGSSEGYRPAATEARPDEKIKVIGLRRKIAQNMAESKRHIPHFSYVEEIDMTDVEDMRGDLNANRGDRPKLTILPFLIVAVCRALPDFPMVNATYDDEAGEVTRHGAVHLGMATQTEQGLMVPVIRDAQSQNVWQLAREIVRIAEAARNGTASPEDLRGSTLTVTSLGPLGGIATTPVINRPEVAIIGPNRVIERPVIVDGAIEARKLMNLSISCDHRVVDGHDAASFVQELKRLLETPILLFSD